MTIILNESYQSNPLTVAQGGFGVASTTAYGLLAGGTTSTGAIQNVGTGAAGQIYLSGGSASLGTYTSNITSTCFQYISQQVASNSTSISFTGLSSTYYAYKIIIDSLVPVTTSVDLYVTMSSNNGVSYYASTDYGFSVQGHTSGNTTIDTGANAVAEIKFLNAAQIVNTAGFANHWEVTFVNPSASVAYNGIYWFGRHSYATATAASTWGQGSLNVNTAVNAILFAMSSGNISTGTFSLWGILP